HRLVFFASRRRHTRFARDWSSDVCSSDLTATGGRPETTTTRVGNIGGATPTTIQQDEIVRRVLSLIEQAARQPNVEDAVRSALSDRKSGVEGKRGGRGGRQRLHKGDRGDS